MKIFNSNTKFHVFLNIVFLSFFSTELIAQDLDSARLSLRGHILPVCTFEAADATHDMEESIAKGEIVVPLPLVCNTPFEFDISTENGALKTDHSPSSGFAEQIAYRLSVRFFGDTAELRDLGTCSASECSGEAAGARGGELVVSLPRHRASEHLIAATYDDVVTIRIASRP